MKRLVAGVFFTTVLLVACNDSRAWPTAPTSSSTSLTTASPPDAPFPPPAPPGTSRALVGVVGSDSGIPAAGAKVIVLAVGWFGGYTIEASGTTDGAGVYALPVVRAYAGPDAIGWLLVGASKPGYFADFKWWLDFPKDADLDLQLDRHAHIRVGERVRGQIGEAMCAGLGYGGWYGRRAPCQRYALIAPISGTLEVAVSAPVFEFDVDIVKPNGLFAAYDASNRSPVRLTTPVDGGLTYEIRIAAIGAAREFELTTALR
jgi:hypothetical protein